MKRLIPFLFGLLSFFSYTSYALTPLQKPINQLKSVLKRLSAHLGQSILFVSGKKEHFSFSGAQTTIQTPFYIGSLTKQMTAFMMLSALQKQYPDQKLNSLLHKKIILLFPHSHLLAEINKPWMADVTLLDLLTHQSGLSDYITYYDQTLKQPERLNTPLKAATLLQGISFNPEKNYFYSNSNYLLIGKLLEEMQQSSFDVIFDEIIKNPAQLPQSYAPTTGNYFDLKNDVRFTSLPPDLNQTVFMNMSNAVGTGNVIATASDLTQWTDYFYTKANPHLRSIMLATYTEDEDGNSNNLGLSTESTAFGPLIGFQGSQDSYHSFLGYLPKHGVTLVILSNNQQDFERLMGALGEFLTNYPKKAK